MEKLIVTESTEIKPRNRTDPNGKRLLQCLMDLRNSFGSLNTLTVLDSNIREKESDGDNEFDTARHEILGILHDRMQDILQDILQDPSDPESTTDEVSQSITSYDRTHEDNDLECPLPAPELLEVIPQEKPQKTKGIPSVEQLEERLYRMSKRSHRNVKESTRSTVNLFQEADISQPDEISDINNNEEPYVQLPKGLPNYGNNCHINSICQVVLASADLSVESPLYKREEDPTPLSTALRNFITDNGHATEKWKTVLEEIGKEMGMDLKQPHVIHTVLKEFFSKFKNTSLSEMFPILKEHTLDKCVSENEAKNNCPNGYFPIAKIFFSECSNTEIGHYTACVHQYNDTWRHCDDEDISSYCRAIHPDSEWYLTVFKKCIDNYQGPPYRISFSSHFEEPEPV